MKRIFPLLLLAVAVSGLFIGLGSRQFVTTDEGRFAEIGRETALSSQPADWVIQKLNGEIYARKPPLFPMLIAASYRVFGKVNEWTAAFPSALFAFLTLVVSFLFWRQRSGTLLAFLATLLLATSYKFLDQGRPVQVDMVLLFFMTSSLLCAERALHQEKPGWLWTFLFFLCCAGATFTKGPVGLALPLLIVGIEIIWQKKWSWFFSAPVWGGVGLYLLLIGGWVGHAYLQAGSSYLSELFLRQSFVRYLEPFDHKEHSFYYFEAFSQDFLPWTLFLPFLFFVKSWRRNETGKPLRFYWIWFLTIFIFFSLCGSKRGLYLLPLYPAISFLLANGWRNQGKKWLFPLLGFAVAFLFAAPFLLDKKDDWEEKKARSPKEAIQEIGPFVGEAPLKQYRMMEPIVLFYLQRTIPSLDQKSEVDRYMALSEKVFLLVHEETGTEILEELKRDYFLVKTFQIKKDLFLLFCNDRDS